MKKVQLLFVQATVCLSLLVACGGDNDDLSTNPDDVAFLDFSPETAFIGDEITIHGRNLGTNPHALIVTFGDIIANVVTVDGTFARVIVPDDIETASVGLELRISLASLKSGKAFTLKAPVIESISPTSVLPGQEVVIKGNGFRNSQRFEQVKFGNTMLKGESVDPGNTELHLYVPADATPGKYAVSVTVAGLTTTATDLVEVTGPPVFSGFLPATAFIGDEITLTGENLGTDPDRLAVSFGGVDATVVSVDKTSAKVIVPDDIEASSVQIRISIPGEELLSSANNFILKAPVVESLSLIRGYSGQLVKLIGKGFRDSYRFEQVAFGSKVIERGSVARPGHNELLVSVPDRLAAGKYPVSVTVAGMTATAPESFEVIVPSVTSFTPASGSRYATMTITGTNFIDTNYTGNKGGNTSVSFADFATGLNSRSGLVTSITDTQITVLVPQLWPGTYKVTVGVQASYVSAEATFTYEE
ncbi:IPT/TIG domain-containing protein [Fulvivirgaceae bacterium PWU5]|uniref:IPT/TIG domain-containing protein n=1 Tax=Dawidia cretensis TaxID=2782350 RepID=A0AAP2GRG2_9BACT|nr:IPT/TIG domain-containing protein [Dawidia cretensis]MBT1710726.1 IPT/TIG domain-containing protein [Dawidia cretensis]